MKSFSCTCGNMLFFENTRCIACGRETGYCPQCKQIAALEPVPAGGYRCATPGCGVRLQKCRNYIEHDVCNCCVIVAEDAVFPVVVEPVAAPAPIPAPAPMPAAAPVPAPAPMPPVAPDAAPTAVAAQPVTDNAAPVETSPHALCDVCQFTDTIPDLSVPDNVKKWYRLEVAKRRLFFQLDFLGLPFRRTPDAPLPLSFDFKADIIPEKRMWRRMGREERVYTGHANGKITINIREADDVAREKLRVDLQEAHRTLIGHFRHEVGHYYWQLLIQGNPEAEAQFKAVFGDHENPTYGDALEKYYKDGPLPNWQASYVSAYATMHPWEDFAETWAAYLDMTSVLDTSASLGLAGPGGLGECEEMVRYYQRVGLVVNELNRSMGLIDLVPEVFSTPVVVKLKYIHDLIRKTAASPPAPPAAPVVIPAAAVEVAPAVPSG